MKANIMTSLHYAGTTSCVRHRAHSIVRTTLCVQNCAWSRSI